MTVKDKQRRFTAAIIDLDDTLYRSAEMPEEVKNNIQEYMMQFLGFSADDVDEKAVGMYYDYGTTLAGLVAQGHKIDYKHWHDFVHGRLDHGRMLQPDAQLRECLFALEMPKYVFTNSDIDHTRKCLQCLGIEDAFRDTITFETLQGGSISSEGETSVLCKPSHEAFRFAMQHVALSNAAETIFIDDSRRNIKAAHELGIFTVLVGTTEPTDGADAVVAKLTDLMERMPELFDNPSVCNETTGNSAVPVLVH